jgi:hypothetical protein
VFLPDLVRAVKARLVKREESSCWGSGPVFICATPRSFLLIALGKPTLWRLCPAKVQVTGSSQLPGILILHFFLVIAPWASYMPSTISVAKWSNN